MLRHGETAEYGAGRARASRGMPGLDAFGADAAMGFASRFTYSPDDLPSAAAALRTPAQQEKMMLRLSNQFHSSGLARPLEESSIPAGYTYLAQFAVHDMLKSTALVAPEVGGILPQQNEETAGLELHSLYGGGPNASPNLYEPSGAGGKKGRLRIGHLNNARTTRPPRFEKGAAADIPRDRAIGSARSALPTEPVLADSRNADTLILAQLTALFITFHNILFDISNNAGDPDPFLRARKTAVAAYRKIVWDDLIGRLTDGQIYAHYTPTLTETREPGWNVPKESAFAVLRFGHTLVRTNYQLNPRLQGIGGGANVSDLLQFFDAKSGQPLPPASVWKIEWSRFFQTGVNHGAGFNNSSPIRPAMTYALTQLSTKKMSILPAAEGAQTSLAFRALMRGFYSGLPTGQAAARAVGAKLGFGVRMLTSPEIAAALTSASNEGKCGLKAIECLSGDDISVLAQRTPLFLYVLLEAQIIGGGSKLGPVGSDFLCHVFAGGLRLPADDPDKNILPISGIGLPGTMPELLGFLERHRSPDV